MDQRDGRTQTSAFGVGRREGHDAGAFYSRFTAPILSDDEHVNRPAALIDELGSGRLFVGSSTQMGAIPDNSVALIVTSPPYFVGKEYELAVTGELDGDNRVPGSYFEFLTMLHDVFAECVRVLEPGGRIAVNVANLGRKPYRSLSADVIEILQDRLGLLLRGEVIWEKSSTASGSCAWGSFAKASNPVLRDMTERVIIASKGRFARALPVKERKRQGLPFESSLANDEFLDVTRDVWRIDSESATRVGHPAPFPVELPRRLIDLYTYKDDIVLDPFAGSGTTLVAAARAGRIGVGYDLDPAYVALAQQRLDTEVQRTRRRGELRGELEHLPAEDRQEHFQALAVSEGRKAQDIARRLLTEAGFEIDDKAVHPSGIIEFDYRVTAPDGVRRWWVDVSGAFTTSKPGLQRTDAVWKLLGRVHVHTLSSDRSTPVLVLTSMMPKPGSPGDKAIRQSGAASIFDVIEMYDPAGLQRLTHYAADPQATPLPGFWTATDLS
jgi:DNA modification methylase